MTYETPPPAEYDAKFAEGYPAPGMFNVEAMTDKHIGLFSRALDEIRQRIVNEVGDVMIYGGDLQYDDEEASTIDQLQAHLGADLAHLAATNPERGKPLLMRYAQSKNRYERRTAFAAAPPLCLQDYEFGSAVFLAGVDATRRDPYGDLDDVCETHDDFRRVLPRDLALDLDHRAYEVWPDGA